MAHAYQQFITEEIVNSCMHKAGEDKPTDDMVYERTKTRISKQYPGFVNNMVDPKIIGTSEYKDIILAIQKKYSEDTETFINVISDINSLESEIMLYYLDKVWSYYKEHKDEFRGAAECKVLYYGA